jgi:hypothetical protein
MKKTLLICFCMVGFCLQAQTFSEKDFKQSVLQLNAAKTESDYDNVFQQFSKFKSSKPAESWQRYYYAAVAKYMKAELQLKKTTHQDISELNALARKYAKGGYSDSKQNNAEVDILLGLIALQKTQIKDTKDVQKDMEVVSEMIKKAEGVSPDSPRLAILKAKMQENSGNKQSAEKLFKKALEGLENKSSASAPSWGRQLIPPMN